jgi:hypothetical protein
MTLQVFSHDIIPIIQAFFSLLGLVSLILVLLQIRNTIRWNKLNYLNTFINSPANKEIERRLFDSTKLLKIDLKKPLDEAQLELLYTDAGDDAYFAIKDHLSNLETLCAFIKASAVDENLSYKLYSEKILQAYRIFNLFIERIRKDNKSIYIELVGIASAYEIKNSQSDSQKSWTRIFSALRRKLKQ